MSKKCHARIAALKRGRLLKGCCLLRLTAWNGLETAAFTFRSSVHIHWPALSADQLARHVASKRNRRSPLVPASGHWETKLWLTEERESETISFESIRDRKRWGTRRLLLELDKRDIRYSPTASRADLESLLIESFRGTSDVIVDAVELSVGSDNDGSARLDDAILEERLYRRARRRQRYRDESETTVSPSPLSYWSRTVVDAVPKVAGSILDRAARKARRLQRRAADFWAVDEETGVRDARYQYLERRQHPPRRRRQQHEAEVYNEPTPKVELIVDDSDMDIGKKALETDLPRQKRPAVGTFQDQEYSAQRKRRSDHSPAPNSMSVWDEPQDPSLMNPTPRHRTRNSDSLLLPSADDSPSLPASGLATTRRPRRTRQTPSTNPTDSAIPRPPPKKRVYSPYAATTNLESPGLFSNPSDLSVDPDMVDKVSEFLANAADKFMWGKFDKNPPIATEPANKPPNPQGPDEKPRTRSSSHSGKTHKHWKDRLEERLDSMLGLHEDGAFYNRWTSQANQDRARDAGPTDAVSYARGRQLHRKRPKSHDKPFWEEEGNLLALLLGRTRNGKGSFLDNRTGFESGSMLVLVRVALKSFMTVGGHLCRWASTQGALPQPVVVFGVGAAALVASPRKRLVTVVITLLLLRTVGELLHGYAYGSYGWGNEDDDDDEQIDFSEDVIPTS
jgi:hypothetical protein